MLALAGCAGTIVMWPKHLPVLFKKTVIKLLESAQSEAQVWMHIVLVTPLSLKGRNIWLKARGQLQHEYGWRNNMDLCLSPISTQHLHLKHITSKLFFPPPPPHTLQKQYIYVNIRTELLKKGHTVKEETSTGRLVISHPFFLNWWHLNTCPCS